MKTGVLLGLAALAGYAAWRLRPGQGAEAGDWGPDSLAWFDGASIGASDVLHATTQSAAESLDYLTGGLMQISAMSRVNPALLDHPNVRAFLRVIRTGEGTADEGGYRRLFGGGTFASYADHPRIVVSKSGYHSSAAGAYQAIASTWDETKRIMRLPDFTPRSQDLFALGRLAARGALEDVTAGRFESAVRKTAREWASLPGSPYGQPTISWERARTVYASAGGDTLTA